MINFRTSDSKISIFTAISSGSVIVLCTSILLGWIFDVAWLRSPIPGLHPARPITVLGLLLTGIGVLLFATAAGSSVANLSRRAIGVLILALSTFVLASYIFGFSTFIDTFLIPAENRHHGPIGNRMPPQTAVNFMMLGISLCLAGTKGVIGRIGALTSVVTLVSTYVAGLGILYNSVEFAGISRENSVTFYSAFCFAGLSSALILRNNEFRTKSIFLSDTLGGHAARRLLPAVILIPTLIEWIRVIGQDLGYYDTAFGSAMSTLVMVILMFGIIVFYSKTVHEADHKRIEAEKDLELNERRYHGLFDYSQGMICIHDLDGVLRTVNPAVTRLLGYTRDELIGRPLADFVAEKEKAGLALFLREIKYEGISEGLLPIVSKSGERLIWRYNNILVTEDDGDQYVIGHAQDVTELIAIQKQLRNLSLTDELTGLYNRRGFLTMAEQQIKLEGHAGTARGLSLMFGDIDGLKQINDRYGHRAGSEAIIEFSRIIKAALRSSDLVARWGGDEFVILTIGARDEDAQNMLDRINQGVFDYNLVSLKPYELSCSIGVTPLPLNGEKTLETVIAEADAAMYEEKRRRKMSFSTLDLSIDPAAHIGSPEPTNLSL